MNIRKALGISKIRMSFMNRHPFVVPIVTLSVLLVFTLLVGVTYGGQVVKPADSKVVTLFVDGERTSIPTRAVDVGDFLLRLNITLDKNDVVEPATDSPILGDNFTVNIYKSRPVTVVDEDGKSVALRVADREPVAIAKKAGLTIYPEDIATVAPPDVALTTGVLGDKIIINRALPVTLSLYGTTYDIRTQARTVAELAEERKFTYDENSILPKAQTELKSGDVVFVTEAGKQIAIVEEAIPQPVKYVSSTDLFIGKQETREEGRPGKRVVVYAVAPNGTRSVLQEVIVAQPVQKLVARGAKADPTTTFGGSFDAALARLRSCEGSYSSNTGNGYYGAYQFDIRTWNNFGGYPNAAAAPPIVQDQKAQETYQRRGWQPWPACSNKLGLQDVYR